MRNISSIRLPVRIHTADHVGDIPTGKSGKKVCAGLPRYSWSSAPLS